MEETLIAFNFTAPRGTRQVELLGSWDNFANAYFMTQDKRRGVDYWIGCYRFENIIYDGDSSTFNEPRTGGLRQGGLYWYYFRLDDSIETFDDQRICSATCPLLPGQMLNYIEIPREVRTTMTRNDSAVFNKEAVYEHSYTLDPSVKFQPLVPPKHTLMKSVSCHDGVSPNQETRALSAIKVNNELALEHVCEQADEQRCIRTNANSVMSKAISNHEGEHTAETINQDTSSEQYNVDEKQQCHHSFRKTQSVELSSSSIARVRQTSTLRTCTSHGNERCYKATLSEDLLWTDSYTLISTHLNHLQLESLVQRYHHVRSD